MLNKPDCIRQVTKADAEQCLRIYQYYADNTAFSFEESAPTVGQMVQRIGAITREYPWLVYDDNHIISGYAYASQFRPRPAYRWTAEVTIYLSDNSKGSSIASALYQQLFARLIEQGFYNAIAVITEPNPESEMFHQKMGFEKIGIFKSIGYKLGHWNDIGWWQKRLQPVKADPGNPRAFNEMDQQ